MPKQPASTARLEPVFRSNYARLVTERTRRGDDPPHAVARVERAYCLLARHWAHIVPFDSPSGWLESSLLTDPASSPQPEPMRVDLDHAWNAMRANLARDRLRHRITLTVAIAATIVLLAASVFLESNQFHRIPPSHNAPVTHVTTNSP